MLINHLIIAQRRSALDLAKPPTPKERWKWEQHMMRLNRRNVNMGEAAKELYSEGQIVRLEGFTINASKSIKGAFVEPPELSSVNFGIDLSNYYGITTMFKVGCDKNGKIHYKQIDPKDMYK